MWSKGEVGVVTDLPLPEGVSDSHTVCSGGPYGHAPLQVFPEFHNHRGKASSSSQRVIFIASSSYRERFCSSENFDSSAANPLTSS